MKHRPFSELTKDWPPERLARSEAKVKQMLAELDRPERASGHGTNGPPQPRPRELRAGRRNPRADPRERLQNLWATRGATTAAPWWLRSRPR